MTPFEKHDNGTAKCQKIGCDDIATCVPKINVPAQHYPIDTHQPMAVIINLRTCAEHYVQLKPMDFMNAQLKEVFEISHRGRQPLDWDRAFVSKVMLDSEEYAIFKRMSRR